MKLKHQHDCKKVRCSLRKKNVQISFDSPCFSISVVSLLVSTASSVSLYPHLVYFTHYPTPITNKSCLYRIIFHVSRSCSLLCLKFPGFLFLLRFDIIGQTRQATFALQLHEIASSEKIHLLQCYGSEVIAEISNFFVWFSLKKINQMLNLSFQPF